MLAESMKSKHVWTVESFEDALNATEKVMDNSNTLDWDNFYFPEDLVEELRHRAVEVYSEADRALPIITRKEAKELDRARKAQENKNQFFFTGIIEPLTLGAIIYYGLQIGGLLDAPTAGTIAFIAAVLLQGYRGVEMVKGDIKDFDENKFDSLVEKEGFQEETEQICSTAMRLSGHLEFVK